MKISYEVRKLEVASGIFQWHVWKHFKGFLLHETEYLGVFNHEQDAEDKVAHDAGYPKRITTDYYDGAGHKIGEGW
jgi:hypothetical protein